MSEDDLSNMVESKYNEMLRPFEDSNVNGFDPIWDGSWQFSVPKDMGLAGINDEIRREILGFGYELKEDYTPELPEGFNHWDNPLPIGTYFRAEIFTKKNIPDQYIPNYYVGAITEAIDEGMFRTYFETNDTDFVNHTVFYEWRERL